ncbi:MAG: OmpA family protein [Woeseiaceae bacterium]
MRLRSLSFLVTALLVGYLLSVSSLAIAMTPPGTEIQNQATATFDTDLGRPVAIATNTVTLTTVFGRTPSTTSFVRLAAQPGAAAERLGPAQCAVNGVFIDLAAPTGFDGQPLDLAAPQATLQTALFNTNETALLRVQDGDQNLDPLQRERVEVTVSNPESLDSETVLLLETDVNTGIFTGYIPLADTNPVAANCILEGGIDSTLSIDYEDPADATDVSQALALIEPLSIVFDSTTGQPVDGATITLIDVATGQPAVVLGNDGVSVYPSTVVSGGTVTDASGLVYDVPAGGYRFPVVAPGTYRLQVVAPAAFIAPSNRTAADINGLPGGPFSIDDASFGAVFQQDVNGVLTLVDVPVDPFDGGLFLTKSTRTLTAGIGDFVRYELNLQNSSDRVPATGVILRDTPPVGFRFVPGSARLGDMELADPIFSESTSTFEFRLDDIPAGGQITLTYVLELTGGVRGKQAVNSAEAVADRGVASNQALSSIRLREDLFRSRSTIIGRIVEASCTNETFAESLGVEGIRVYMEDGRFAVTDAGGRYHIEGVQPGRHTVQIDTLTLPEWLVLAPCENTLRFGGSAESQWVNLRPGLVQRADFYLKRRAPDVGSVDLQLRNAGGKRADTIDYTLTVSGKGEVPLSDVSTTILLPKAATLVSNSARLNGRRITSPRSTGNAVIFAAGDRSGEWQDTIKFSAKIDPQFAGELTTKAVTNFNTPAARNQRTPVGEARMMREAATTEKADYVLSLTFDVLSAELSDADRGTLDSLIETWNGVYDIEINAIGHTDADGIAARNRQVFADNYVLSEARARAAVEYLAQRLDVKRDATVIVGRGPDQPVATNATEAGKRRNRRVELVMNGIRPGKQSVVEVTQAESGQLSVGTTAGTPGPGDVTDPLDRKIAAVNATTERQAVNEAVSVEKITERTSIVAPAADYLPAIPSMSVVIAHAPNTRVELTLNGSPVSSLNFDGTEQNLAKTQAISKWRGVDLEDGDNALQATVVDSDGNVIEVLRRSVHYAGQPIRGEFVEKESRLIADGRRRPVVAVKLFDGDGQPARAASIGGFSIDAPYRSWFEVAQQRENKLVAVNQRDPFYRVGPDGIAYIELEPTTRAGEVTLRLQFQNQREQELRVYLQPEPRDWILVGFAEGTVGYNTLRDNQVAADRAGAEEDFYQDGRVAFFAKGRIRGDYLLTLAYDTRGNAQDRDRFDTEVVPDEYFTLYGDGTESRFEAASQRKLYVKIERRQFAALFGDFDTGLSTTELARYERRFNGLQTQYFGKRFALNAFAAESDQSFQRDDIAGDGTSGLYQLSGQDIVVNSDKIRIETRDRFNASQVLSTQTLTRFVDYDIDYFAGTLFFKRPVPSRDQDLNPQVIVAEYESRNAADDDVVAGGRAAVRFDDGNLEIGATVVRENNTVDANMLLGVDVRWQMSDETLLRAEYADTETDDLATQTSGYAYKVSLEHRSGDLDARVFHEKSDGGFGLGLQAANQLGIQNTGVEARWQLTDRWFLQSTLGFQENLDTGTERELGEAEIRFEGEDHAAFLGLSSVRDEAIDGTERESMLVRGGASRQFLGDKLTLRVTSEQALSDNDESLDFPSRTLVGVDWNLSKAVLFAEHEFADGANIDAQTSRLGVRATPWQRAQFTTTLDNEITEFGPRLFANVGLVQGWQLSERWTVDIGMDHSNTLVDDRALVFDTDRELASGSLRSDFVAGYVGALYQSDLWSMNTRVEHRNADTEARDTVVAGWFREPIAGHALSAGIQYLDSDRFEAGSETRADIRFGWAYRVADRRWSFLNRLDLISDETQTGLSATENKRYINNFNAVKRLGAGSELALQYASKYVRSEFDGSVYSGYTDLMGIDFRRQFRPRWDYGVHASILNTWDSGTTDFGLGAEIGFNPRDNLWLSFGYNVLGFRDEDFDNARYTASGPYLNVTIKADQHTLREIAGRIRGR